MNAVKKDHSEQYDRPISDGERAHEQPAPRAYQEHAADEQAELSPVLIAQTGHRHSVAFRWPRPRSASSDRSSRGP
jgi:hypothetical protein